MRRVSAGNLGSWRMPLVLSVLDQGLVSGAHFGLNVVLARWTSPAEYGVFAVTFGIFLFILNGLMLILTSKLSAALGFGFHVAGFGAAFWGALVVSIVSAMLSMMMRD